MADAGALNIAQGSAALAMLLVFREQKSKGLAVTSSISAFLGVTEPAIFGVNIRYKYPFIFGMIGSAIGGLVLTINHVLASSIGVGGIPGFRPFFRISGESSSSAWPSCLSFRSC